MNEDLDMSGQNELRSTPERRILGELGNNPDSPTANLRLLTTLASTLKSATDIPCQGCSNINITAVESTPVQDTNCIKLLPRKEKSLSLLCNKFLNLYPLAIEGNIPKEISLNTTAQALSTEKRRIYDIINVLESLEMASKAGKNQYYWYGQSRLSMTLAKLKMSAIELGLDKQIQEIQKINRAYIGDSCHSCGNSTSTLMVPQSPIVDYSFPDSSAKEDKSLGVMCRKFVMLFLVSLKNGVINLDIAAKVLINEQDSSVDVNNSAIQSRLKTKVRRLYDIANVLSAIGLIEKVDLYNCVIRKPIFKYTGPSVDCINFDAETPCIENGNQTLVGMTTPSKKSSDTFRFRALNRISRLYSSTPIGTKREARKRKLFDSDNKFQRTKSSPCLSSAKSHSSDRLDDSILQVVEMELKRIKSCENKPKVCTKLFPRSNSESCISPSKRDHNSIRNEMVASTSTSHQQLNISVNSSPITFPVVSNENLVKETNNFITPIRTVRINVPLELKIAPITKSNTIRPKFVKLSKFDMKKLVPISKEDIKLKLASTNSVVPVTNSTQNPNIAILTQVPTKKISPGDIFKAIKVGNTLQFVPMENKSDSSKTQ